MSLDISLQDKFLKTLCEKQCPASIFMVNGVKLQGSIEAFDKYVVVLKNNKGSGGQIVFKRAISTIVPTQMDYSVNLKCAKRSLTDLAD